MGGHLWRERAGSGHGARNLNVLRSRTLVVAAILVVLAVPLLVYVSIGGYARYTADDYCWAGVLRTQGFWPAQVSWYLGYSPRYAFTFLVNLVELAGPGIVPVLPVSATVIWVITLSWTFAQFKVCLGGLHGVVAAVLVAETIVLATFQTAPDIAQSLYWQTGMLTYLLPLIIATFLVGWIRRGIARGSGRFGEITVCAVVTFVAGGLSETYLIPQNVTLTLSLGLALLAWRSGTAEQRVAGRAAVPYLAAALAGGVVALIAIVAAPSIGSRVGGGPADLWLAMSAAIATGTFQVLRLARHFAPTLVLCVALPGLVAALWRGPGSGEPARVPFKSVLIVGAVVAVVLPFCYFPSFYAQNGNPPARALIVPGSILAGFAVYVGVAGVALARAALVRAPLFATVTGLILMALVPLGIAATTSPERALAADYAARWDAEDALIRAQRDAGQRQLIVPPLPSNLGEDYVTADPKHFFNVCVARYYGVDSIAASD